MEEIIVIPECALVDIIKTIVFTLSLLLADVLLRITIECNSYMKVTGKRYTIFNMITTVLWFGWGEVCLESGVKKRFLVSKGLRTALIVKMAVQYPAMFAFAALSFLLPDIVILGWQFDSMISFTFSIIPVICEITSIIEKLNMLDAEILKICKVLIRFIKSVR